MPRISHQFSIVIELELMIAFLTKASAKSFFFYLLIASNHQDLYIPQFLINSGSPVLSSLSKEFFYFIKVINELNLILNTVEKNSKSISI
jgi:hypothetical protein